MLTLNNNKNKGRNSNEKMSNLSKTRFSVVADVGDDVLDGFVDVAEDFRQVMPSAVKTLEVRVNLERTRCALESGRVDDHAFVGEDRDLVVDGAVVGLSEVRIEDLFDCRNADCLLFGLRKKL